MGDDAIVPPTPARDVFVLILRGAFRVMAQEESGMVIAGSMRAGLCGEPMAMTKGVLELDAVLGLRSSGEESGSRGEGMEVFRGWRGVAMMLRVSCGGGTRMLEALEVLREIGGTCAAIVSLE
jgi:hypothetical protein